MIHFLFPQVVVVSAAFFAWLFPSTQWSKETHDLMQSLCDEDKDHTKINAGDLKTVVSNLPNVIQQWINAVLPRNLNEYDDNKEIPFARYLRVAQKGKFLFNGKYIDFTAAQEFSARSQHAGYVWDAEMIVMSCVGMELPIHFRDSYVSGKGMLQAQMPFGLPVMDKGGSPDLDEGELLRWCAEAVLFPLALVWPVNGSGTSPKWHASNCDENAATLEFVHNGTRIMMHFNFDPQTHLVTSMHCIRPRIVGSLSERVHWEGYCYDYERRGGMLVPTRMECGWKLDMEKDVELYFKGKNEGFIYLMS